MREVRTQRSLTEFQRSCVEMEKVSDHMKGGIGFSKTHLKDSQAVSNSVQRFYSSFTEEKLSLVNSAIEPSFGAELQQWLSAWNFLHLYTGSLELSQSSLGS